MPIDVRIVFLVRGENQRNQLRLVAESVGEERADGPIDLARGQNFFFAGPAFALDKAAGNAPAGVGVLAVIHREGEEIDAFPGSGEATAVASTTVSPVDHQRGARGLLGHAAGLKNQPFAAGKLDGYFMLGRHSVLVSFCSLGKLVWGSAPPALQGIPARSPRQRSHAARSAWVRYSVSNGDRDQCPVWVLPVQCWLSDYLRIPSLPITSR